MILKVISVLFFILIINDTGNAAGGGKLTTITTTTTTTTTTKKTTTTTTTTTTTNPCAPIQSQGFVNLAGTNKWYYAVKQSSTYDWAKQNCQNIGAQLASIHSSSENNFLMGNC